MRNILATACAAMALLSPAFALSTQEANKLVEDFIAAPGYAAFDVETLHEAGSPYEKNFPTSGAEALHADAMIGPIEKSLLLVNSYETQAPDRVRYAVSYSQIVEDADGQPETVMLVEVRRYNLGPIIRKYALDEYGPENTGAPEDFGIGPDVAWRFAFASVMGNTSLALSGSRRVIADGEAQMNENDAAESCPAGPCRSVGVRAIEHAPAGAGAAVPVAGAEITAPYTTTAGRNDTIGLNAAFVARNLQLMLGLSPEADWVTPETPEAGAPGEPFIVMQIDQNLGQEIVSEGLAGWVRLNDDAASQIWVRAGFWNAQPPSAPERLTVGR